ncbi:glycosyltransferase family 2 protein [Candidatus Saccharibacteria bacterium]|nr:glycosyltransferase family 2 protein [Candidatus Saccharibacteria bacterium]
MRAPVSVIVPVYNGEKTIGQCLDSLVEQSHKKIKIICVDDGSTDGTSEILNRYRKKYRRVQIINQKNGGRSLARNTGLKAVKTKYVMFCDSDDWYEKNMCENMIDAMERSRADLVVCGVNMVYETHDEMKESDENYYKLNYSGEQQIDDEKISKTNGSVCNKIFKMDVVRGNKICFPKDLNTAEDYYFYCAYMSVSKTVYFLNQKLYNYRRHDNSIMSNNFNKKKLSMDDILVAEKIFNFYRKNGFIMEHKDLFWRQWIASFWASYRYSAEKYHWKIKEEAEKFLDKNYEKYKPSDSEIIEWKNDIVLTLNKIKKGE